MEYNPDRWCLISIELPEGTEVKVLGGWDGGYLDGGSWRLSSGVTKVIDDGDSWIIHNKSGSTYMCNKKTDTVSGVARMLLGELTESHKVKRVAIEDLYKERGFHSKSEMRRLSTPRDNVVSIGVSDET